MDDPQRLVDDPEASPLARSLLASAAEDAPGARSRAAVARRLGIAAGLLAMSGEVGAGGVAGALWWKIGLVVVALGGAITGGVAVTREPAAVAVIAPVEAPAPAPAPPAPPAPSVETAETAAQAAPAVAAAETAEPAAAAATAEPRPAAATVEPRPAAATVAKATPRAAAATTPPRPSGAPEPEQAPAPQPEPARAAEAIEPPGPEQPSTPAPAVPVDARRLAAEVSVLDRARAALRRGDTAAATAALDEHARGFTDGSLLAEAELLRIEVLVRAGDAALARQRARDFLVRFPQSPLARRLRSLIDRLPPPAPPPAPAKESP